LIPNLSLFFLRNTPFSGESDKPPLTLFLTVITMKKTWLLIGLMLASLFIMPEVASADASEWSGVLNCTINSPTNQTYNTGHLTLNVSLYYAFAYFDSQTYSIDDQPPAPFSVKLLEPELSSMAIIEGQLDGLVTLPPLPDGEHKITIYMNTRSGFPTRPSSQESTVYFTVDTTAPQISNVSLKNQAFNEPQLHLTFTVDEQPSWMGYSIDNTANMTLTGNTTITSPAGQHNIVIYANDTAGNMGPSEMAHFTVQVPASLQKVNLTWLVAAVLAAICIAASLVVYRRKRSL
jgi:hypothetical protein